MEDGTGIGTYAAYGLICLFLVLVVLVVARTTMLMSLLLVEPVRHLWERLARRSGSEPR